MKHSITITNGLLSIENGMSFAGVSLEMVESLVATLTIMSSLVSSLEGTAALEIPEVEVEYSKALSHLKYLRTSRKNLATNQGV